jgi:hypothetical protein
MVDTEVSAPVTRWHFKSYTLRAYLSEHSIYRNTNMFVVYLLIKIIKVKCTSLNYMQYYGSRGRPFHLCTVSQNENMKAKAKTRKHLR